MILSGHSNTFIDIIETDFKAEVIAAEIVENGVSAEEIIFILLGSLKRSFSKDVDEISEEISDHNNKAYTHITVHKEGIYDMLPQGLFHSPSLPKSATTQKEIINSIKKHRVEEINARRFFLPFEAAINHLRIQMAQYESRLDKGAEHDELLNIFKDHWEIFKYLDTNQSNIFLQVLPLIHNIRDDRLTAVTIFELIFSIPVKISCQRQAPLRTASPLFSCLSNSYLGINLTTGNEIYYGGEDEIIITIGPITNDQLRKFMPGTVNSKIKELLCDYLLPAHIDITTNFELFDIDKTTRLVDKEHEFNSTLGLSTYL
ncbi:MAG: hypothetical protein ABI266_09310 [Ginsengibacter sp.]